MKEIIIVAGPNGAGKTSFADQYLRATRGTYTYLNADEIAKTLVASGMSKTRVDVAAGRIMLQRIEDVVTRRRDLMIETTLATLIYKRKIPMWRHGGYSVAIFYLRLPHVQAAIARVARRVATGGHTIPVTTIKQRFSRSLDYFEQFYKPIVDEWYVWDSLEGNFAPAESWDGS